MAGPVEKTVEALEEAVAAFDQGTSPSRDFAKGCHLFEVALEQMKWFARLPGPAPALS